MSVPTSVDVSDRVIRGVFTAIDALMWSEEAARGYGVSPEELRAAVQAALLMHVELIRRDNGHDALEAGLAAVAPLVDAVEARDADDADPAPAPSRQAGVVLLRPDGGGASRHPLP